MPLVDGLEGKNAFPDKIKQVPGLENTLKIQHEAAQILKQKRHEAGSLTLRVIQSRSQNSRK